MSSVILTSYFSKKIHPNDPNDKHVTGRMSDGRVIQNDIQYIKNWYDSVKNLDLEARIFCDNLSEEFIEKYTTDKIKFVLVEPTDYSNNDWRFFCYRNYLEQNKFDSVFLTDSSDVVVVKDPNLIISEYSGYDFFVCKDSLKLSEFPYLNIHSQANWENFIYFAMYEKVLDLINMGAIGGTYDNVMLFLNKFCETRIRLGAPSFNSDMWTGQYVFRHILSDKKILIGEPFTSIFKQYQNDRKDVFFIHK
jgi:hypothetical protein